MEVNAGMEAGVEARDGPSVGACAPFEEPLAPEALDVRVVSSVAQVDAKRWDALAGDDVLSSYGWLRTAEGCFADLDVRYVLLCHHGEPVAAAAFDRHIEGRRLFTPDPLMLGRFRKVAARLGATWLPALSCGAFRSFSTPLLLDPRLRGAMRERVRGRLLDAVEEFAAIEGMGLWLPRIPTRDTETTALLRTRGYRRTLDTPVARLDIAWDSFDGYLAELRRHSRNMAQNARSEISRNRAEGVTIDAIEDPTPHRERLFELADAHYRGKNGRGVPYSRDFLPELKRRLGGEVVLYGAFQSGDLIGFSVLLRRAGVGYLPYIGLDRERTRSNFTYFNLSFYRPIADAIEAGLRRLYGGTLLYGTKARRGYGIEPMQIFYRSASPLRHAAVRPWFALVSARRERRAQARQDPAALRKLPGA